MNIFFTVPIIILTVFCVSACVYVIYNLLFHKELFGIEMNAYLYILIIINGGVVFPITYSFSAFYLFSLESNLILFKTSLIVNGVFFFAGSISYFLLEVHKIKYVIFYLVSIVFLGMLIGTLLIEDSITIHSYNPFSFFYVLNPIASLILIAFHLLFISYFSYLAISLHISINKRSWGIQIVRYSISIALISIIMVIYLITSNVFFLNLYLMILCLVIGVGSLVLLKNPRYFFFSTSRIYYINIYHKSGVLLYSHRVQESNNEKDSVIWGNILIGLNHILSEFVEKSDKIDVLETKASDIIVNYNEELGFAVLVIADKKNPILIKSLQNFTNEFKSFFRKELTEILDYNKIINMSDFFGTREIVTKNFKFYI